MNKQKDEADYDTHAADNDVCYSEERILATEPRRRRQNHSLCTTECRNWIGCKQWWPPLNY